MVYIFFFKKKKKTKNPDIVRYMFAKKKNNITSTKQAHILKCLNAVGVPGEFKKHNCW